MFLYEFARAYSYLAISSCVYVVIFLHALSVVRNHIRMCGINIKLPLILSVCVHARMFFTFLLICIGPSQLRSETGRHRKRHRQSTRASQHHTGIILCHYFPHFTHYVSLSWESVKTNFFWTRTRSMQHKWIIPSLFFQSTLIIICFLSLSLFFSLSRFCQHQQQKYNPQNILGYFFNWVS